MSITPWRLPSRALDGLHGLRAAHTLEPH